MNANDLLKRFDHISRSDLHQIRDSPDLDSMRWTEAPHGVLQMETILAVLGQRHRSSSITFSWLTRTRSGSSMRTYHSGVSLLHFYAAVGNCEAIEELIAKGETLTARLAGIGPTALHQAAAHGQLSAVQLLVASGVDINIRDSRGDTPLSWAELRSQTKVATWMRKNGGKS